MADGKFKLTSLGSDVLKGHSAGVNDAHMLHANVDIENIMAMSLSKAKVRT